MAVSDYFLNWRFRDYMNPNGISYLDVSICRTRPFSIQRSLTLSACGENADIKEGTMTLTILDAD